VIFLHGLGDTPAGWSDLEAQLPNVRPSLRRVKWAFPAAPTIPISINGGAEMPGWFDLYDWPIKLDAPDDREGVERGVATVRAAIAAFEADGIPADRIVVGGFSQGGAIALNAAYRHPTKLAGCAVLSGWLTLKGDFGADLPVGPGARETPCFWGHGTQDDKVLFPHQKVGVDILKARGVSVNATDYPVGHTAHPEELARLAMFVEMVLEG